MLDLEAAHDYKEFVAGKELARDPALTAWLEQEEHRRPFKQLMDGANLPLLLNVSLLRTAGIYVYTNSWN